MRYAFWRHLKFTVLYLFKNLIPNIWGGKTWTKRKAKELHLSTTALQSVPEPILYTVMFFHKEGTSHHHHHYSSVLLNDIFAGWHTPTLITTEHNPQRWNRSSRGPSGLVGYSHVLVCTCCDCFSEFPPGQNKALKLVLKHFCQVSSEWKSGFKA